jgi:hypothetical protein
VVRKWTRSAHEAIVARRVINTLPAQQLANDVGRALARERLTETSLITLTKRVNSAAHRGQYAVESPRSRHTRNLKSDGEHNLLYRYKFGRDTACVVSGLVTRTCLCKCPHVHTTVRLHFPLHVADVGVEKERVDSRMERCVGRTRRGAATLPKVRQ